MLVTQDTLEKTLSYLKTFPVLAVDTETTGLRPYHGDRLFSIIIATSKEEAFYFNFNVYPDMGPDCVLGETHKEALKDLLSMGKTWVGHNLKYDMHMLGVDGIQLGGRLHCTKVTARLVYNLHMEYSLEACAERIGYKKDDAVEKYIAENKLFEKREVPGVKKTEKVLFYNRVPASIIVPYGETDAKITYALYESQVKALEHLSKEDVIRPEGSKLPPLTNVYENECELLRVVYEMERDGIKIDTDYCRRAIDHEERRAREAVEVFERTTGEVFLVSGKLFAKVFADQKEKWKYTDKGNPSFDGDVLSTFTGVAAQAVNEYRDAKARANFLNAMLWHTDANGFIHPHFNQDGTITGRFSSKSPSYQNQINEAESSYPWKIRKAVVPPSEEYVIFTPDYSGQELRAALYYAKQMELIERINSGEDMHMATALLMGLCREDEDADTKKKARKKAKGVQFALIYGASATKLGDMMGLDLTEATVLKNLYFRAMPKMVSFIKRATDTAKKRKFLVNMYGRVLHFPNGEHSYAACNTIVQSSCADCTKFAMVAVHAFLRGKKSRLAMTIHDELVIYLHKDEQHFVNEIRSLMKSSFPSEPIPMEASKEYCPNNWAEVEVYA